MSEMGSDDATATPADALIATLVAFTGCVGEAMEDLCSYSLTIGETYVPFDPDEDEGCDDEDEDNCSQLWVRVTGIEVAASSSFDGGDCAATMNIGLEVGILRCFPTMEDGEAPTASMVLTAAAQSMIDMNAIMCAGQTCEAIEEHAIAINIGSWSPMGPMGGEYGGVWTFTLEI